MVNRLRTPVVTAAMLALSLAGVALAPAATAAPSCVAQSVADEHQTYGTAWGNQLIAYLATHPAVLQEFGFNSFGDLAAYAATQPHDACPADL
jgi:hypothetical protein